MSSMKISKKKQACCEDDKNIKFKASKIKRYKTIKKVEKKRLIVPKGPNFYKYNN